MNVELFATDIIRLWLTELAFFGVPAAILGAVMHWAIKRWYPCLLLSIAAAVMFVNSNSMSRHFHHPVGPVKLLGWGMVLVVPPIAIAASAGYFIAKMIKARSIRA